MMVWVAVDRDYSYTIVHGVHQTIRGAQLNAEGHWQHYGVRGQTRDLQWKENDGTFQLTYEFKPDRLFRVPGSQALVDHGEWQRLYSSLWVEPFEVQE